MANPQYPNDSTAPIASAVAITKNDSTTFAATRGIYVGVSGDVIVLHAGDSATTTYKSLAAGVFHPISIVKVMSTGTTATDIVGCY